MSGLAFSIFSILSDSTFFCELYCHNTEYAYCHMNKLRYYSSPSHLPHILDSETLSSTFSGHLATLDKWTSKCCTCSSSWPWHSSLFSVFFSSSYVLFTFDLGGVPTGGLIMHPAAGSLGPPPPPPSINKCFEYVQNIFSYLRVNNQ